MTGPKKLKNQKRASSTLGRYYTGQGNRFTALSPSKCIGFLNPWGVGFLSNIKETHRELAEKASEETKFKVQFGTVAVDISGREISGYISLYSRDIQIDAKPFWEKFNELKKAQRTSPIQNPIQQNPCVCEITSLLAQGCTCGGV